MGARGAGGAAGAGAAGTLCGLTAVVAAKVALLALNVVGAVLGCSLIGLGAYRTKYGKIVRETFKDGSLGLFDDPYMAMVVFGCGLLLVSTKGFFGALWQKRRVLLAYFAILLVMVSALVFGAAVCFTFQEKADIIITKYMDRLRDTPYEHTGLLDEYYADSHAFVSDVNSKLGAAGGIFTLCASCVVVAMGSAAILMGLKYTLQSATAVTNFATLVGGGVVLYLSIASKVEHVGGTWVPELLGVAGGLMCVLSLTGICAINAERRRLLKVHFGAMILVAILFAAAAVAAFAYSSQTEAYIERNWERINERILGGKSKAETIAWWEAHLILIGMGASIATTLLTLNLVADLYLIMTVPAPPPYENLGEEADNRPLRDPPPRTVGLRRLSTGRRGGFAETVASKV